MTLFKHILLLVKDEKVNRDLQHFVFFCFQEFLLPQPLTGIKTPMKDIGFPFQVTPLFHNKPHVLLALMSGYLYKGWGFYKLKGHQFEGRGLSLVLLLTVGCLISCLMWGLITCSLWGTGGYLRMMEGPIPCVANLLYEFMMSLLNTKICGILMAFSKNASHH